MCYISVRKERHSYDILKRTGEFVINLTNEALAEATDWCGVRSGRHFDKFKECGLSAEKSAVVSAPSIAEAPVSIECRVKEIVPLGSHDMFVAEVVSVAVDEQYIDSETGKLDLAKARLIAYAHGEYFALGERGDEYRQMGWPAVTYDADYKIDPKAAQEYDVLVVHYAFAGSNDQSHLSEKDLIIAAPTAEGGNANLLTLVTELKKLGGKFTKVSGTSGDKESDL
jgi:flavin reductase (DIM6/NTAB) family NADH-FMN oxidoreductase RutF